VDQKEEKDLWGVGQAQVWSDSAGERQPAFHVATYAALLVAAINTYGLNNAGAAAVFHSGANVTGSAERGPLDHQPPNRN
jgi:hypothetical protein